RDAAGAIRAQAGPVGGHGDPRAARSRHSTTGWPETAQAPQSAARLRPQPRHVEGDVHALVAADRYVRDVPVRGRVVTLDDGHGTVLDRLDQLLLRDRRPDLDGRNRDRGEGVRRHHLLDEGPGARVVAGPIGPPG